LVEGAKVGLGEAIPTLLINLAFHLLLFLIKLYNFDTYESFSIFTS